jgi:stage IV sporulation protein FB
VPFVLKLFSFVVMHEYGHALMARRFGVRTRGITHYPIGGVAMLESMPTRPSEQILVALAGPAVNFVLAGMVFGGASALGIQIFGAGLDPTSGLGALLGMLFWANLIMGAFNLLPALPMDGGRVLRAALAMRMPAVRATQIAGRVAKVIAVLMAGYAFANGHFMLGLIAMFVWIDSNAEARAEEYAARRRGDAPHTEVIGATPWQPGHNPSSAAWRGWSRPGTAPGSASGSRVAGMVVEVVEGPNGPEVRVMRPR